jgi:hypothetical protein
MCQLSRRKAREEAEPHLDRFPAEYDEALGPAGHEARELLAEDALNVVGLLDLDREPE